MERLHAWMNGYGKLRRCTGQRTVIVEFYLDLATALVALRRLINRARTHYRVVGDPTHDPSPALIIN